MLSFIHSSWAASLKWQEEGGREEGRSGSRHLPHSYPPHHPTHHPRACLHAQHHYAHCLVCQATNKAPGGTPTLVRQDPGDDGIFARCHRRIGSKPVASVAENVAAAAPYRALLTRAKAAYHSNACSFCHMELLPTHWLVDFWTGMATGGSGTRAALALSAPISA